MRRFLNALILPAILLSFSGSPAFAAGGNIHFGALEVHPFASVKETWSDNIYSTPSGTTESDRISTYIPGVRFLLPFGMHKADLQYFAVINNYRDHAGENTADHNARGMVDLNFGSRFGLSLSDAYQKGHEPRSSSATGFIEKFTTNGAKASLSYQLADLSKVQLDYTHTTWTFKQSTFRDRDEDLAAAYLYYRFLPKTSAFVEFDYANVDFSEVTTPLDNKVTSALAGVTWEITDRSKGTVKAGRMWKDFKASDQPDTNAWTASADVSHKFTDYSSIMIVGQRTINETNFLGTSYYVTTGAYAEFTHRFGVRFAGVVRGSRGEDRFSNATAAGEPVRHDTTVMTGLGLKYTMKEWLEFGADFNYRDRDSNINANDFREHQYVVSASVSL
ncbi:MAG: outer membrane beta-barrel protein [Nitrospiraceae bacterium]|nr:outer membrane beta-barrel protein [Nitrospiraceae bacterium]